MRANKKIRPSFIPFSALSGLILLLSGCAGSQDPVRVILPADSTRAQQSSPVKKRFQASAQQSPTAVESAIELSKKYAKLSEEAAALKQKNQDFIVENHRLKNRAASLETQLQQTQKELSEANKLLIEMRIELNNWKTDILGFRGEMRGAEKAQLEALLKILKVLGGEVRSETTRNENTDSITKPQNQPLPMPPKTPISGKTNE